MSGDLKSCTIRRGVLKGQLTRFKKFIGDSNGVNLTELEARLERISPLLAEFEEIQCQIECLQGDDSQETCSTELEDFEKSYFTLISQARDLLKPRQETSESDDSSSPGTQVPKVAKLPQISLPDFDGGYEFYQSFKDQFGSLVDKRQDIDAVQKLIYLRSTLKGEALEIISSLETTARNYSKAWTLLEQRYDNKRLVVGRHLREIFDTEKIDKESSVKIRRLVSNAVKHIRALESLDLPVEYWDAPLVFYLQQKLDSKTLRDWETSCDRDTIPTFEKFTAFLLNQAQILEALEEPNSKSEKIKGKQSSNKSSSNNVAASTVTETSDNPSNVRVCPVCNNRHKVFFCRKFLSMSVPERKEFVAKTKLCPNCLRDSTNHTIDKCPRDHCKKCDGKHNTLLHSSDSTAGSSAAASTNSVQDEVSQISTAAQDTASTVLLSTAVIRVLDRFGAPHNCRALLDSGSQLSFVSEKMSQILGLPSFKKSSAICGIGGSRSSGHRGIHCQIQSQDGSFKTDLECIVMPKITLDLPTTPIDVSLWKLPSHITLADPAFFKRSSIHMLIGAAEFYNIMECSQISLGPGFPVLQNTKLGWVVSGKLSIPEIPDSAAYHDVEFGCSLALEECIRQFWEIEEVTSLRSLNPEEQTCEDIFMNTTTQDESGRFEVHLPIRYNVGQLEDNRDTALKRFFSLERKLEKNLSLKNSYVSFMREYISLGHRSAVSEYAEPSPVYYLPHHCVINEHSSTTKLRVVFDGSCKSLSGLSLNDVLMVGPTIQEDLVSILMRFRQHKYVMTADVTKMYRQVNVCDDHRSLQRIFWRESPDDKLQVFNLNTVTYGTGPASYLSTRCLKELAIQSQAQYPQGSTAVHRDFYVDDYLGGCDSIEDALILQQQIIAVTQSGGFNLHKWCANEPLIVEHIPPEMRETKYELNSQSRAAIRTLGVWWDPSADCFSFCIRTSNELIVCKRSVLSEVARIFDPLGLLGPVILQAKLFLKQLWIDKFDWDTPLESTLKTNWLDFRAQLSSLEDLKIPRRAIQNSKQPVEIHGFSDASEKAYGASIFLRSQDDTGRYHVQLLCSKSRVSPVNNVSIPRLELCGALLLSRLAHKCFESLSLLEVSCHLWTDSTVTLSWIAQPSGTWKTFVSNRVSEIHSLTKNFTWHHIPGAQNPSDMLSRGLPPKDIGQSQLWWNGPSWLAEGYESWPSQPLISDTLYEAKVIGAVIEGNKRPVIRFERFSNFNRLINSTAYALRFMDHLPSKPCVTGPISAKEWERALCQLIKLVQRETFEGDFQRLHKGQSVAKKGLLASLNPILDSNGIIRVGGRLDKANLSYDQKHQIILPASHRFTFLLVKHFHHKSLHAGPQLLLASIRQQYWPLHGKSLIRKMFHSCVTCFRHQPRSLTQMMGTLPAERVQPCRPFLNAGVDFCGPLTIKSGTLRQSKSVKAYAALFICLATKAVHVELVSDMTTPAFINALKRFFARRGKSKTMFSDNGTNFVGASRELKQYIADVLKNPSLINYATSEQITWKFIPARAPHMGGIWESAIKSLKFHLRRVVGEALLTFEEMSTVLTMIEACLNSRPLIPLSNNPNDLSVLTPGHFLIGDALTAIVEPDLKPYREASLKRWARLQRMFQHFWDRWANEYLSNLQSRQKWEAGQPNLPINQLVLIKEDNIPPLKWHLGRIIAVHPGSDGRVRVASVKTVDGVFRRHVSKLCPLPNSEEELLSDSAVDENAP